MGGQRSHQDPGVVSDLKAKALHFANRLSQLGQITSPERIAANCSVPSPSALRGCAKFAECDLHPEHLKNTPVADIKCDAPAEYARLKDIGCLRPLLLEHPDELDPANLSAADYFAAVPLDTRLNGHSRVLAQHRCPYHGCVVPEMMPRAETARESPPQEPFRDACPYQKVRRSPTSDLLDNPHRLLACELTRKEFRSFQRELGIASIAPVAIVPGQGSSLGAVLYIGKDPSAGYQYLTIDPVLLASDSFLRGRFEYPQAQARLHAPRMVRHEGVRRDVRPWTSTASGATLATIRAASGGDCQSPIEEQLGIRYIPCGQFGFLCLLWLWSGSDPYADEAPPEVRRAVTIESTTDLPDELHPLLLDRLIELGFGDDVKAIYGEFDRVEVEGHTSFVRRSTLTEDLELLGLITCGDVERPRLTARAAALTAWLADVIELAEGAPATDDRFWAVSAAKANQCLGAYQPTPGVVSKVATPRLGPCRAAIDRLGLAASRGEVAAWIAAIRDLLASYGGHAEREAVRRWLRTTGFPVYPLAHLTLLLGFESALDWVAIPLGGPVRTSPTLAVSDLPPQGAAFILCRSRPGAQELTELVETVRPVLGVGAFADTAQWVEEVLRRKAAIMDYGSVTLARTHEILKLPRKLAWLKDPSTREARLRQEVQAPDRLRDLSEALGEAMAIAMLSAHDAKLIGRLRENGWELQWEQLATIEQVVEPAWSLLAPLNERAGRKLDLPPDAVPGIWAPLGPAIHLVYEALRNMLAHGTEPGDSVVVRVRSEASRTWIDIYAPRPADSWQRVESEVQSAGPLAIDDRPIRGMDVFKLLSSLAECDLRPVHGEHPLSGLTVGVLQLGFLASQHGVKP